MDIPSNFSKLLVEPAWVETLNRHPSAPARLASDSYRLGKMRVIPHENRPRRDPHLCASPKRSKVIARRSLSRVYRHRIPGTLSSSSRSSTVLQDREPDFASLPAHLIRCQTNRRTQVVR